MHMIIKNVSLLIVIFFAILNTYAQNDTINQTNDKGLKQGYWIAYYANGEKRYEGYFNNDKPVDTMKKYYHTGILQAILIYSNNDTVHAKLFSEKGERIAEGDYYESLKHGTWTYFSPHFMTKVQEEKYKNGQKHGISKYYYPNGNVSEEIEYTYDIKNGIWNQYFEDGLLKVSASYKNNLREGSYALYYPDGEVEISGNYKNDLREGPWKYYNEKGVLIKKINFIEGIAENTKEIIKEQQQFFDSIENNKGKFKEPTETIYGN